MKNNRSVTVGVIIFTIIVIVVIVGSQIGPFTSVQTATPTNTFVPSATFTPDPCSPEVLKTTVLDFNKNARAFDDLSVLAQNTPREQLVPVITQLQNIRRESEDFVAPPCMAKLQEYQLSYMNVFIDTLVALYSSLTSQLTEKDVTLINQGMATAVANHDQYMHEMARLLGITLAPTATVPPPAIITSTPTP